MPNPINALVRVPCASLIRRFPPRRAQRFNIGQVEGGTSVNSIPHEARLKVDIRSRDETDIC